MGEVGRTFLPSVPKEPLLKRRPPVVELSCHTLEQWPYPNKKYEKIRPISG
jgi:hypothetical protein